jgi:hypothetical protein
MHAALCLLAGLNPHDWQCDITTQRFTKKLFNGEMTEEIFADLFERYDRAALVLGHQQKQRWRRMPLFICHGYTTRDRSLPEAQIRTLMEMAHLSDFKSERCMEIRDSDVVNGTHSMVIPQSRSEGESDAHHEFAELAYSAQFA